jgi:hypothetical protein
MTQQLLTGSELVLVARVPKAGPRWRQVHFNAELVDKFFRLAMGKHLMTFEHVDLLGQLRGVYKRTLVLSDINRNPKIEFNFGDIRDYPETGVPLLVLLELDANHRRYRYLLLRAGDPGYEKMRQLNEALPSVGKGLRRVLTTLDEVELRWPGCTLRRVRPGPEGELPS